MSFEPIYRCQGPTCLNRCRAENDDELLGEGWLTISYFETPEDEDTHETKQADFCSRDCARGWLDEESW